MILKNDLPKSDRFDLSSVGRTKYDMMLRDPIKYQRVGNLRGEVKWIPPKMYIQLCADQVFHCSYEKLFNNREDKHIDGLVKKMKDHKVNFPYIDLTNHTQDGLHRAIASNQLDGNDTLIPVLFVTYNKPLNQFHPSYDYGNKYLN